MQLKDFKINIDTVCISIYIELNEEVLKNFKYEPVGFYIYHVYQGQKVIMSYRYYRLESKLTALFSLPKFLYGSNLCFYSGNDYPLFQEKFIKLFQSIFGVLIPAASLGNAVFRRLDLNIDIKCNKEADKKLLLAWSEKLNFPRLRSEKYETGSKNLNKSWNFTCYDKQTECSECHVPLVRMELQLKRKAMSKHHNLTCYDVLKNDGARLILWEESMGRLLCCGEIYTCSDLFEIIQMLIDRKTKRFQNRVFEFYQQVQIAGIQAAKAEFGSSAYRYLKILLDENICPAAFDNELFYLSG